MRFLSNGVGDDHETHSGHHVLHVGTAVCNFFLLSAANFGWFMQTQLDILKYLKILKYLSISD